MVVLPDNEEPGCWRVQVQAGACVVADSRPEAEYQETLNKARGMLRALACLQTPRSSGAAAVATTEAEGR
jgi:anthranilate synthase component 1